MNKVIFSLLLLSCSVACGKPYECAQRHRAVDLACKRQSPTVCEIQHRQLKKYCVFK